MSALFVKNPTVVSNIFYFLAPRINCIELFTNLLCAFACSYIKLYTAVLIESVRSMSLLQNFIKINS